VTLTGAGGVGKTRLALQVARRVSPRFGDGAWLCELAPVRDMAAVDDAVAAVFSVTARAGQSTWDGLVEFLRDKQLLLVLDNCEHLLEGAAALADVLHRSCERLAILATSREGLGIEGERLVPVPPLAVPRADADLTAITQAEAVQLFAERAAAVKPEFVLTAENAAPVAAAVRRLDGIALAIELAAARLAAMTPAELARRLQRSFAVLGAARRGTLPHHQTLRATIDWSYQLLAKPEQRLLARAMAWAFAFRVDRAQQRFPTASAFANHAGAAPVEIASAEKSRHRLSRHGDRQLNSALHTIAITQIRIPSSRGHRYYKSKIAEGKTPREAARCLKRRLADHLWRTMITDERQAASLGGHLGTTLQSSAAGSTPTTSSSDKSLPRPANHDSTTTKPAA
jgi:predicted ATPase